MKPYPEGNRDRDEIKFNKELSSARVKVECAFGLLISRWRILQNRFDSGIDFAVKTAIACVVLHNLCIRWGDDWEEDDNDEGNPCPPNAGPSVRDVDNMRETLKDYICNYVLFFGTVLMYYCIMWSNVHFKFKNTKFLWVTFTNNQQ